MYNMQIESNQSSWVQDVYNQYIPYKTDGFLVEFGVGHTLEINRGNVWDGDPDARCGSNTGELLDLGWSGIYVEPTKEFCDEAKIAHKNNLDRLTIINIGASDKEEICKMYMGNSLVPNNVPFDSRYKYIGETIKCKKASNILNENNCPNDIDLMSIDVEGYELKLINGLDFNIHIPRCIIIEHNHVGLESITHKLKMKGYALIHSDNINAFFNLKKK